ncbi:unnamed protein product [Cylicocyclus nassatus]|uniref:Uncharacterized protein n=1 Tax=Cylicocyclus nassatus TaxID=53992 RepID=A0AA36GXW7_CYLNA|nr:unnamed protein product [Cylicocyclus nassatus]
MRTRDRAVLAKCDVIVDVGGVHDHSKKRYDHHQLEFNETMQTLGILDFSTRLSSAGLIYAHYGKQLIAEILDSSHDDKMVYIFFRKLYETFVEAIDAIDNGIHSMMAHPGFIGGNKAFEGALAMAKKALEIGDAELAARSENGQELKKMKLDNEQAVSSTEQAVSSTVEPAH